MAFATKPKIDPVKAAEFVQATNSPIESTAPQDPQEIPVLKVKSNTTNDVDERVPYMLRFPSAKMHQDTKMAALKSGKNLRTYILDLIDEENKKYI